MRRLGDIATPLLWFLLVGLTSSVKIIDNGLAPPEIVHTPVSTKPRCKVFAPPLDLLFILDSSGSLREKFQDEIDIIRRIIKHVTIGKSATRVMLIQFSGTQHLEFNFEKFIDREELLAALDVLRHVSGITRIGGAFEFALQQLKDPGNGMRDGTVPKIVYLLSDGRTHDFPKDWQMADILRREIPNVDIWAYGTGDYVAMTALANYTQSEVKIVTNENLQKLEPQFDRYRGTEICEQQPGTKKFLVERVLGNINIHPEAVRVALITYSGQSFVHFKFNSFLYGNNTSVQGFVKNIRSIKGTTATNVALMDAFDLLTSKDPSTGIREGVPKMALVMTDGHSHKSPKDISEKMRASGIIMIAVSVTPRPLVDEAELQLIAGDAKRAFTPPNLHDFEGEFMKHVGFGCDGIELPPDAKPQVRGATDVKCTENSMSIVVRTQRALQGLMYAHNYHDEPDCMIRKTDNSREIQMTFTEGTCGLVKTPSADGHGYHFNITVILQFHPLIITRADQGLDMSCFVPSVVPRQELDQAVFKNAADTQCVYRLHSCEVDQHFLETPNYSRFKDFPDDAYVFQEMSVFKFPGDGDLLFHCKISLCNMQDKNAPCNQNIPPKCPKKTPVLPVRQKRDTEQWMTQEWRSKQIRKRQIELKNRSRRQIVETKAGYYMTLQVETR
uniref:ZP domain-containing protein n=1 Tax=Caenorhabditis japonica TaxID=281687 RepID=A0A8R1DV22_CAEJA